MSIKSSVAVDCVREVELATKSVAGRMTQSFVSRICIPLEVV